MSMKSNSEKPVHFTARPETKLDSSAITALARLGMMRAPISGKAMKDALFAGFAEGGQAEFNLIQKWVAKNGSKFSPEARKIFGVYVSWVNREHPAGRSTLGRHQMGLMSAEMDLILASGRSSFLGSAQGPGGLNNLLFLPLWPRSGSDSSAAAALNELDRAPGLIKGNQMAAAIEKGMGGLEGESATVDLELFTDWAKKNQSRLLPQAKQVLSIYEKYGKAAQARGHSGISIGDFMKMAAEMKNVKDAGASAATLGQARYAWAAE